MATDEMPKQESESPIQPAGESHSTKFVAIFIVLVILVVGEIYSIHKMSALRSSVEAQQAKTRNDLFAQFEQEFSSRLSALERSNAQQLGEIKDEFDAASHRMGATSSQLRHARAMVARLELKQQQQADALQQQIALKADQQQLGALTNDVTNTRSDLDTTKRTVGTLQSDLGMARSQLGELIAHNHGEIEELRRLGERDYYEFTLKRGQPQQVAGIMLDLKKTNVKRYQFTLNMIADDIKLQKKNRTVNEPIIFYVHRSKTPLEVVVNRVESQEVVGYLSTPKGLVQMASRSEGAQ